MQSQRRAVVAMQATREWVQALPASLKDRLWDLWNDWADLSGVAYGCSYYERLTGTEHERRAAYAAWRADNWRRYPHLITEPVNEVCDDDNRLAAEWMAATSNLPLLLCEIYCCCWQDDALVVGALPASRPRELVALALKRRVLAPGALTELFSWLRRERLVRGIPVDWMWLLPAAPSPRAGAWTSVTTWQSSYFEVEVAVGGFESGWDADRFGRNVSGLQFVGEHLILPAPGRCPVRLADANVQVRELRAEAKGQAVVDDSDFEIRRVPISEFGSHPDLSGTFGSSAYRVEGGRACRSNGK